MVGHDQILPLNTAISWLSNPASTPARGPQTPLESGSHIEEATETLTLSPALAHAGAGVYFGSSQRKEKEKNKIKDLFLSLSFLSLFRSAANAAPANMQNLPIVYIPRTIDIAH